MTASVEVSDRPAHEPHPHTQNKQMNKNNKSKEHSQPIFKNFICHGIPLNLIGKHYFYLLIKEGKFFSANVCRNTKYRK